MMSVCDGEQAEVHGGAHCCSANGGAHCCSANGGAHCCTWWGSLLHMVGLTAAHGGAHCCSAKSQVTVVLVVVALQLWQLLQQCCQPARTFIIDRALVAVMVAGCCSAAGVFTQPTICSEAAACACCHCCPERCCSTCLHASMIFTSCCFRPGMPAGSSCLSRG